MWWSGGRLISPHDHWLPERVDIIYFFSALLSTRTIVKFEFILCGAKARFWYIDIYRHCMTHNVQRSFKYYMMLPETPYWYLLSCSRVLVHMQLLTTWRSHNGPPINGKINPRNHLSPVGWRNLTSAAQEPAAYGASCTQTIHIPSDQVSEKLTIWHLSDTMDCFQI